LYWKFTYGKWIYYSYENEGFINFLKPQIPKVWFSTLNGQFLYVPATFLLIIGMFFLYRRNKILSVYSAILFFVISYLFASWWSWNFGCGFGIRPYVDFFPIFAISLAALVKELIKSKNRLVLLYAIILILLIYNINLIYSYDGCWYGGIWDWKAFIDWVLSFEGVQKVFFYK
jgi:ABC-type branched-subunit amino acid transport system permease subunit